MNRIMIQQVNPQILENPVKPQKDAAAPEGSGTFRELLQKSINQQSPLQGVKFSFHAIDRLQTRNIMLSNNDMSRLNSAVSRAEDKGSRESLVLMNDLAFIVSVKNKTIVTAMTHEQMQDRVITNIDSTIIV